MQLARTKNINPATESTIETASAAAMACDAYPLGKVLTGTTPPHSRTQRFKRRNNNLEWAGCLRSMFRGGRSLIQGSRP
ncbi:uncharacterized protein METZ01_LOCUS340969 [marine metagenome]|uniref:Uncharacterized protein n=1 Tax=marine metagenome TaxID=408172 RepID=A0A382QTD3_9ZZZZ